MAWFQVDDQLALHRKVCEAGNPAMGLWVRAGAWSMANLTEGFVPKTAARTLGTAGQAAALVRSGLWIEAADGYRFHEWSTRQMSAEEIAERRRKRAEAGRKGGLSKRGGKPETKPEANAQANASTGLKQNQTPVPVPTQEISSYVPESATEPNANGIAATPAAELVRRVIPNTQPDATRTALRHQASALLKTGTPAPVVEAALAEWLTRTGVGPGVLPSIAADVVKRQEGRNQGQPTSKMRALAELANEVRAAEQAQIDPGRKELT